MRLNAGDIAKDFSMEDILGNQINLRDYAGKKLLLSFFRFAKCPYCNLRVSRMISRYPTYHEAGLEMIAVFESPPEGMFEGVAHQNPPFPLIADPENELYNLYGVEISKLLMLEEYVNPLKAVRVIRDSMIAVFGKGFRPGKIDGPIARMPADFLIRPDLTIEQAHYGTYVSDHLRFEEVERFLALTEGVVHQASGARTVGGS